jgi:ABC-type antimicrobial peptide transport system permease subunit
MALALIGAATGLVIALALSRYMSTLLYGVRATDPVIFGVVTVSLLAVALAGTCIPAQRAMRIDPVIALRHD